MIRRNQMIQVICLALLLCMVLVLGSVTYSRYQSTLEKPLTFQAKTLAQTGSYRITSDNGWQKSGDGMVLDFTLSGGENAEGGRAACLRLTATEGLNSKVVINLTVDGKTYQATPHAIQEGGALYTQMGGGTEFRFANADGELGWQLKEAKNMRLTVLGASDQALLRLIAMEK